MSTPDPLEGVDRISVVQEPPAEFDATLGHAVYGLLVGRAGANEAYRDDFIRTWVHDTNWPFEWRFQGSLGFGGKVLRQGSRISVSCYHEDETPERLAIIADLNDRLAALR